MIHEILQSETVMDLRQLEWKKDQTKTMGIAGYVFVCVQLYCMLVSAVFHYMFRSTWPSSSV
jgi:hypothetical protein